MTKRLYKYLGPGTLEKVFSVRGKCAFKCSYPKDFNDPYELFLTIDFNQSPDILAFYRETIGNIPQLPTTCFSKSPEVIPMWAHYAQDHKGFVIEVDEEKLSQAFPDLSFGDVHYQDEADPSLTSLLHHAHGTCKFRHVYFLQTGVFSAAYFTKNTFWSYELERRLVAKDKYVCTRNKNMLLQFPISCISAIIVGHRATSKVINNLKHMAGQIGCPCYNMCIGNSTTRPYFIDVANTSYVFKNNEIVESDNACNICCEPIIEGNDTCPWCSIEDGHESDAAIRNPMRLLSRLNMLEDYYRAAEEIRKGDKK